MELPHVTEEPHHGIVSFRVRGKIFASVPDHHHLRVMLDESEIRATVAEDPAVFEEFYWGKRLACAVADLAGVTSSQLRWLLTEAWLDKAPAKLARQLRPEGDVREFFIDVIPR